MLVRKLLHLHRILFSCFLLSEFLTGFHKRKLAKAEAARSKAKAREKQERLEARREVLLYPYHFTRHSDAVYSAKTHAP